MHEADEKEFVSLARKAATDRSVAIPQALLEEKIKQSGDLSDQHGQKQRQTIERLGHAAGYLQEVWQPDQATERLRRFVARRAGIVQSMTRTKNRIHAVLHANLIPPYQGRLFMTPGRKWLAEQP